MPIVIGLGTGQTLAFGTTLYLPAILAEPMAVELGIPPGWAFGAFSLALIFSAFLGPKAGARIDQFGGRTVLAVSSLIFAVGLANAWQRRQLDHDVSGLVCHWCWHVDGPL